MNSTDLIKKFQNKEATVAIIGLGYVGLPLALRCIGAGFKVIGIDVSESKVAQLRDGISYIHHISSQRIQEAINTTRLSPTTQFDQVAKCDAIVICVPTPLGRHQEPDISYITATMTSLLPYVRKNQLISLESTTYPGTTDEEIATPLTRKGFTIGQDIFVAFSPEREDPGNPKFHTQTIPKVVGGVTPTCTQVGVALYSQIIDRVVDVSSAKVAEMSKLLENIYRSVNIGLVNELKTVCDPMGINIWEVIKAASTKPFGFVPFYPGPGLGGHCIPIDPFYLTWKAREFGVHTRFIELAGQVNTSMPKWVITKVTSALNTVGKSIRNSKILVLGVAYKKNIDDCRESPALEIIKLLEGAGAVIDYSDPYVSELNDPHFPLSKVYQSKPLDSHLIGSQDCVLIVTDHDAFDYELLQKESSLIVDTRGRYSQPTDSIIFA